MPKTQKRGPIRTITAAGQTIKYELQNIEMKPSYIEYIPNGPVMSTFSGPETSVIITGRLIEAKKAKPRARRKV